MWNGRMANATDQNNRCGSQTVARINNNNWTEMYANVNVDEWMRVANSNRVDSSKSNVKSNNWIM